MATLVKVRRIARLQLTLQFASQFVIFGSGSPAFLIGIPVASREVGKLRARVNSVKSRPAVNDTASPIVWPRNLRSGLPTRLAQTQLE